jgi:acetyl-CoA acetyltransferase
MTREEVLESPMVADPLRLFEICAVSDGAAAAVLQSPNAATNQHPPVWVAATAVATSEFGDPSVTMPFVATQPSDAGQYVSEIAGAGARAFERAGLGPDDVDLIELTDNSVWQELAYPELWGFCEPGEADRLVETGETYPNGKLPINPSGGFLCFGEATVAMGLFQVAELVWQLRGHAGSRQVEGARVGLAQTLGLGGYGTAIILNR